MKRNEVTIQFPWVVILTIIFAVLKMAGILNISWFWVFIPVWFILGIAGLMVIFIMSAFLISQIVDYFS